MWLQAVPDCDAATVIEKVSNDTTRVCGECKVTCLDAVHEIFVSTNHFQFYVSRNVFSSRMQICSFQFEIYLHTFNG